MSKLSLNEVTEGKDVPLGWYVIYKAFPSSSYLN